MGETSTIIVFHWMKRWILLAYLLKMFFWHPCWSRSGKNADRLVLVRSGMRWQTSNTGASVYIFCKAWLNGKLLNQRVLDSKEFRFLFPVVLKLSKKVLKIFEQQEVKRPFFMYLVKDAFSLILHTRTSTTEYTVLRVRKPCSSGIGRAARMPACERGTKWTSWWSDQRMPL